MALSCLLVTLGACASAPARRVSTRPPVYLPHATSAPYDANPTPPRSVGCEIRGQREVGPISLFVRPDDDAPVATLVRAGETELVWSGFRHGIAALEFRKEHEVRFSGFAAYGDDWTLLGEQTVARAGASAGGSLTPSTGA
jgi:hypothetical protein